MEEEVELGAVGGARGIQGEDAAQEKATLELQKLEGN